MKKGIWILMVIAVLLGCSLSIGAEQTEEAEFPALTEPMPETEEALPAEPMESEPKEEETLSETVEWQAYIEDELLPLITMVLTVIAGIYVAISPILAKIKKASEKFKNATEDVNTATGTVKRNETKISELEAVLSEKIEQMEKESAANRKTMLEIEQMLRLGLGNMNELVMKGCARSIVQIGQDIEETLGTVATVAPQEETDHEAKG